MKTKLLFATAVLALVGTNAHATADACAVVLKTPDGFLALREGPSTRFKIVHKLKRGDFLYVDTAQCGNGVCSRQWTHVTSVPRFDGRLEEARTFTKGWVANRFVEWFLCPDDQESRK